MRQILVARGFGEDFLQVHYEDLPEIETWPGAKEALARILKAQKKQEKVLVFGDYDVDGVSASTVMYLALKKLGIKQVEVRLPDRFKDGYGMKMDFVAQAKEKQIDLVVTVDCGSGAEPVIKALKAEGIDTVVTDHHEIPSLPVSAVAVINPKRKDMPEMAPLSGVGVAFMLARALDKFSNHGKASGQEKWLLDLASLGTICDAMPLLGANRIIVKYGLIVLQKTRRIGLKALAEKAKIRLENVNEEDVAFRLGPRINAAGRIENANLAFKLINTHSRAEAESLAEAIERLNQQRRKEQERGVKEAEKDEHAAVIIRSGDWHEGVIGIIAGKLTEKYHKPSLVFTRTKEGILKGSGRSFGDFNLAKMLAVCGKDLCISGGGHAQACGLSLLAVDLAKFSKRVEKYYQSLKLKDQEQYWQIKADLEIKDFAVFDAQFFAEMKQLAPFGEGNPEPVFAVKTRILGKRIMKDEHLALTVEDAKGAKMRMMSFFAPQEWLNLAMLTKIKLKFKLRENEWRGVKRYEGEIVAIETC